MAHTDTAACDPLAVPGYDLPPGREGCIRTEQVFHQ